MSNQSAEGLLEDCDLFGPARDDVLAMAVKMANVLDEPGQDLEADFPKSEWDSRRARRVQQHLCHEHDPNGALGDPATKGCHGSGGRDPGTGAQFYT